MKNPKKVIVSTVLLLAAIALARVYLFRTEEDRIRRVLAEALQRSKISATEGPIARIRQVSELSKFFADTLDVSVETGGEVRQLIKSRSELREKALAAGGSFKTLEVMMLPARVEIAGDSAEARAEIHVLGSLPEVEGQFYERHDATIGFVKVDGAWKIARVATVDLRNSRAENTATQ